MRTWSFPGRMILHARWHAITVAALSATSTTMRWPARWRPAAGAAAPPSSLGARRRMTVFAGLLATLAAELVLAARRRKTGCASWAAMVGTSSSTSALLSRARLGAVPLRATQNAEDTAVRSAGWAGAGAGGGRPMRCAGRGRSRVRQGQHVNR